jgi:hypothetical protein
LRHSWCRHKQRKCSRAKEFNSFHDSPSPNTMTSIFAAPLASVVQQSAPGLRIRQWPNLDKNDENQGVLIQDLILAPMT